jgi:hypothetical protein
MRNAFGRNPRSSGFGADSDPNAAVRSSSQDQIAIVWAANGDVIVASPLANGSSPSSSIDVARFPAGTDILASVSMRRTREFRLPPLSRSTRYLTAVTDHSERTQILALDGEKLSYDDTTLLEWLVNAERQMLLGTDNHPVFETALEETACSVDRLPNGQVAMTEVPRQNVNSLAGQIRTFSREPGAAPLDVCIETPLRSIARHFLTLTKQGAETLHQGRRAEVTAFLSMNTSGYSFGLWSPVAGLFSENAFLAPDDVRKRAASGRRTAVDSRELETNDDRSMKEYVQKAFDQLLLHMSPEKLQSLQLSGYVQIVCAAESGLMEKIAAAAQEVRSKTGLDFVPISSPVEEAVASGLLLGSYTPTAETAVGAENVPPVNLARDILVLANSEEALRRREEEARLQERRNRAVLTVLAPPLVTAGILLALVASLIASSFFTAIRESRADARAQELKPAVDRRKAYEANLKWYQEFISEVSKLRRQQPVGIGLLSQLNSNYPFAADPAFFVSDMKLTPTGDLEMKGMARNKDAVATFLRSLEFAGGEQSGSRLFSNLAYEIQEVAQPVTAVSGQPALPKISGSTLATGGAAPGTVQWKMTGNYVPVAAFMPKPAASPAPGAPKPAVPAPPAAKPAV